MKRLLYILLLGSLSAACTSVDTKDAYKNDLQTLRVQLVYPSGYETYRRAGVEVKVRDQHQAEHTALTDADGYAWFRLSNNIYDVTVQDKLTDEMLIFNGLTQDLTVMAGDRIVENKVQLTVSVPGIFVIKEFYFGGCPATPAAGSYTNRDTYVIVHNNSEQIQYLDNICLGSVDPYNATGSSNPWVVGGVYPDFVPIGDCVWQLAGSGTDFPVAPGADAVIALRGAVDHTQAYPMSVNLNNSAYFVTYDPISYNTNYSPQYYPVPGDQILASHEFKVVKKTGTNTTQASPVSQTSPAFVIFRAPDDVDFAGYLADDQQSVAQRASLRMTKIPWKWVIDGVEVFAKGSSAAVKRLRPEIDAGDVEFTDDGLGYTVMRQLDEVASGIAGYEIYLDTNNSTNDFYERTSQSLHQ